MEEETVKRQVLHKQARKIVFKVYNYFKNVNEQNAAGHLDAGSNVANMQETTAEACGVGLRTVQRILLVKERGFVWCHAYSNQRLRSLLSFDNLNSLLRYLYCTCVKYDVAMLYAALLSLSVSLDTNASLPNCRQL